MKFPIANITIENWNPNEDYLLYILMDPFIYKDDEKLFRDYFFNYKFVDSNGDIYRLVDRRLPTSLWRRTLKFLPNIFKIELIFTKTNERMDIEAVRNFIIRQVGKLSEKDLAKDWIKLIKNAKTISEILGGEQT